MTMTKTLWKESKLQTLASRLGATIKMPAGEGAGDCVMYIDAKKGTRFVITGESSLVYNTDDFQSAIDDAIEDLKMGLE
jgi:hypothetical protein